MSGIVIRPIPEQPIQALPKQQDFYSDSMPERMRAKFKSGIDHASLTDLRQERSILATLLSEKLALLSDDSPAQQLLEAAEEMQELIKELRPMIAENKRRNSDERDWDLDRLGTLITEVQDGIRSIKGEAAVEELARDIIRQITSIQAAETIRLEKLKMFVPNEQLIYFEEAVGKAIAKHLEGSPGILEAIKRDLLKLGGEEEVQDAEFVEA